MERRLTLVAVLSFFVLFSFVPADAHKPIQSDGKNISFENALQIPDHKISWVIYEELEVFQTKFYSFEAKEGEPFYASIVIPKLERLEAYKPSLALAGEEILIENIHNIDAELPPGGIVVYDYDGVIPSDEFYEPFGQTTYWERQEIKISIPEDGTYYIMVFDSQGFAGKYSLAVGTIEDFSMTDFFTVLPSAWFETKIFYGDYFSISIFFSLLFGIPVLIFLRIKHKKAVFTHNATKSGP
jgi:hypothetical protein